MEEALRSSLEVYSKHEEETNKMVGDLKLQTEESMRVKEAIRLHINEKNITY